jgi:hypothetical protein
MPPSLRHCSAWMAAIVPVLACAPRTSQVSETAPEATDLAWCWLLRSDDTGHDLPLRRGFILRLDAARAEPGGTPPLRAGKFLWSEFPIAGPVPRVVWQEEPPDSVAITMYTQPALLWHLARSGDSLVGTAFVAHDSGGAPVPLGPALGLRAPACEVLVR